MSLAPAYAVLTAAGSGTRLGHELPKALVPIGDIPILAWAVDGLVAAGIQSIVITAHESHLEQFHAALAHPHLDGIDIPIRIVPGGETRQASVAAGLAAIPALAAESGHPLEGDTTVLVHDAARALTPADMIQRVVEAVTSGCKAVIPCLPVSDTLKIINHAQAGDRTLGTVDTTVDRFTLVAVQTPQGFTWDTITRAHEQAAHLATREENAATDDAGLVERMGLPVHIVEGAPQALKVTTPWDLKLAEFLVKSKKAEKS